MNCDTEYGVCEAATTFNKATKISIPTEEKIIKIIYYTDPICSSCWGVEPQLKKLKLEYGHLFDIEYKMGGLLPDWSYNNGEISKPLDVASHWDEASLYYDMPIDGDLWLEDPMSSSYPPSIAFKAAQIQSKKKAVLFLRRMRELMFLKKINMTKWENIVETAKSVGLEINQFTIDYKNNGFKLFKEDLLLAQKMRVKGFPSFFFTSRNEKIEILYGARPYQDFENKIKSLHSEAKKIEYNKSFTFLFKEFHSLTIREFSELSEIKREKSETILNDLYKKKWLKKITTKNGSLFFKK